MTDSSPSLSNDDLSAFFRNNENADTPMLFSDTAGSIQWLNHAMEDLADISGDTVLGTKVDRFLGKLLSSDNGDGGTITGLLSGDEHGTICLSPPHKPDVWMEISGISLRNGMDVSGRLFIFRDVTGTIQNEEILEQKSSLERVISEMSRRFATGTPDELDECIETFIGKIGRLLDAERCYLFVIRNDEMGICREYAWTKDGIAPVHVLQGIRVFDFPWTGEWLNRRDVVHTIHPGGKHQTCVVPFRGRTFRGFIGLDSSLKDIPSIRHNPHLFRIAGEMILLALERWEVEEILKRHDTMCESVMAASGSFLGSRDWEPIIPEILKTLGEGTGVDRVYIIQNVLEEDEIPIYFEWNLEETHSIVEKGISYPPWYSDEASPWNAPLTVGHAIAGRVKDLPERIAKGFVQRNVRSFAIVPIFVGDQCWGYMGFDSCTEDRTWEKAEIDILKTAADSLGSTISQKERDLEIQDRNRQLAIINEIIGAIGSASSIREILRTTLEQTIEQYGIDHGAIYMLEKGHVAAEIKCSAGMVEEKQAAVPVMTPDTPAYRAIFSDNQDSFSEHRENGSSTVWIPLRKGPMTIGAMSLSTRPGRRITSFELRTLEAVGKEIGTAIEKVRLQQELEDSYEKANLYLDIMAHDIKNATTVSIMYSDMLREMLDGEAKEFAEKLMDSVRRTIEITEHVSTIRRLHEEKPVLKKISLDAVIEREIERHPGGSIHFAPAHLSVLADDLISEIFANLIDNSLKFGGGDVEIFIRAVPMNDYVELTVEDTGPGIPDNLKNIIFNRFQRGGRKESGKGLGLYIVRMLIERYGGKIHVMDRVKGFPDQGATFWFTLKFAP